MTSRACLVTAAIVVFAAVTPLVAVDADRDFSGTWVLDPQASVLRALPALPEGRLVVDQREMAIHCAATAGDGSVVDWSFTADGKESRATRGQESRSTLTKWEGSALLTNVIVSGPSNYSIMDRWELSKDRSTLVIERQIVAPAGESEGKIVYRRLGQTVLTARVSAPEPPALRTAPQSEASPQAAPPAPSALTVRAGTRIPLSLVGALNTKSAHEGDGVYLETAFPIFVDGLLAIPRGSYVRGTVTTAKQAGRVKGKSEMYIRFDSLTLPNGVTRDFRSRPDSVDASAKGQVDRTEGTIRGEGSQGSNVGKVARDAGTGASVGSIAGVASGRYGMGVGLGGAIGGLAGLASVLGSHGSGVSLPRGTTMEMVLDRDLAFTAEDLRF